MRRPIGLVTISTRDKTEFGRDVAAMLDEWEMSRGWSR